MAKLKQIECDPDCGFLVRSHDEKEVMSIGATHAKKMHKMSPSQAEIKAMVKNA